MEVLTVVAVEVVVSTAEAAVEDSTEAAVAVPMVVAGSVAVAAVPVGARGLSEEALTGAEGFAADRRRAISGPVEARPADSVRRGA